MNDRELLDKLGKRLDELREAGLTDSEEYAIISEEWQMIANDLVILEILGVDDE